MNDPRMAGLLAVAGWCFFSALARVMTSDMAQAIPPMMLGFYTLLIAFVVFNLLNLHKIRVTFHKLTSRANFSNFLWLNLSTMGAWYFLIYPLKYMNPALVSSMTLGLAPVGTVIMHFYKYKTLKLGSDNIVCSILLFILAVITAVLSFQMLRESSNLGLVDIWFSIVCCFIVGFSNSAQVVYAKRLSDNHFSPVEILAPRFFLTILLSGLMMLLLGKATTLNYSGWGSVVLLAIVLIIIPLYLVQIGIKHLPPISIALTGPAMPIAVFVLELFNHRIYPQWWMFLIVLCNSLVLLIYGYSYAKKIRVKA